MPKKQQRMILEISDEEEAAINAGIAADPDTYVATDEEWYAVYGRDPEVKREKVRKGTRLIRRVADSLSPTPVQKTLSLGEKIEHSPSHRSTDTFVPDRPVKKTPKKRA